MRPAFSSAKAAAGFALLLLGILLSPILGRRSLLPSREQAYSSAPWAVGGFPYLQNQIFNEKEDIDIAFMGSSPIWWAIDTPYVQDELSKKLGRPAVVRTLGWSWHGFDAFYFIAQDLLQRRKVRMMVFGDLSSGTANTAHPMAFHWFRFADNDTDLAGLPLRSKASFYSSAMLGMPHNLLGMLRSDLPAIHPPEISLLGFPRARNPADRLGSLEWQSDPSLPQAVNLPPLGSLPSEVCVYSPETAASFQFSPGPLAPLQSAFVAKIGKLARTYGVQLVYLELPKTNLSNSARIESATFWPHAFQSEITMVGIPNQKFFTGMSHDDAARLYFDYQHLNQNGQRFFTQIITPTLIRLYENQTQH